MHFADVLDIDRRAVFDPEHDVLYVGDAFEIAAAAHEIFRRRNFESFSAHVTIARLHARHDLAQRNAVSEQRVRIEIDLIFLHETADWRDFGHAFHRLESVTQIPILNRPELCQVELVRVINESVLVNPADARRVRTDRWAHALGTRAANRVEIFDHARARPAN